MGAMDWEEYDVQELGRLMIRAGQVEDEIDDCGVSPPNDDDRETLRDALYHAHKAARLLRLLALKANSEYRAREASEA